jgi:hypothetical protein
MKTTRTITVTTVGVLAGYLLAQALQPITLNAQAPANGKFSHVDFSMADRTMMAMFDKNTGEVWIYNIQGGDCGRVGAVTALGAPLGK